MLAIFRIHSLPPSRNRHSIGERVVAHLISGLKVKEAVAAWEWCRGCRWSWGLYFWHNRLRRSLQTHQMYRNAWAGNEILTICLKASISYIDRSARFYKPPLFLITSLSGVPALFPATHFTTCTSEKASANVGSSWVPRSKHSSTNGRHPRAGFCPLPCLTDRSC